MPYPKEYLNLQLEFAYKVSLVTKQPINEVLLKYTSFYKHFGIPGWEFDPSNEKWQKFLEEFNASENRIETIYSFCPSTRSDSEDRKMFGCFSYDYSEKFNRIYIHFRNTDESEFGPLSSKNTEIRKHELKTMFQEIKEKYPDVYDVSGFSWMYNIYAYKRLFPKEYTDNAKVITTWFQSVALWGQFLDNQHKLKEELYTNFLRSISDKDTLEEITACFPYKVLQPETDVSYFYTFLDI